MKEKILSTLRASFKNECVNALKFIKTYLIEVGYGDVRDLIEEKMDIHIGDDLIIYNFIDLRFSGEWKLLGKDLLFFKAKEDVTHAGQMRTYYIGWSFDYNSEDCYFYGQKIEGRANAVQAFYKFVEDIRTARTIIEECNNTLQFAEQKLAAN